MPRIHTPAAIEDAPAAARPLLDGVKARLGRAPNLYLLTANAPAALEGLLALSGALGKGALDAPTRERIALAVANVNGCDYCNAAHGFISKNLLKLSDDDIAAAREGGAANARANAAVSLARKVALARGAVAEADIDAARRAGLTDAELVEVVAHVALNTFTNYINEAFKTEIDFPAAAPARRAA